MGFFERFKSQPRWKHPDPGVRMAAVDAMPDEDQELLAQIAREDEDARVRRAAVAKLSGPAALIAVLASETDESVRAVARDSLVAMAQDGTDEAAALQALEGIAEQRDVMIVARSAEVERVALAALERLQDSRLIATVARQGTHAAVRLAALARLQDPVELLNVAIKTEHRDVGLSALERVGTDRNTLETVAVRARSKVVQRRARAALHALVEAEVPPVPSQPAAQRRVQLCDVLDALANSADLSRAEQRLEAIEREWSALAGEPTTEVVTRYEQAVARLRELLARSAEERAAHEREMQALADEIEHATSSRLALCEKVEALDGDSAAAGLDEARTIWVALAPWPEAAKTSTAARQLEERFQRACAECERRLARAEERRAALARFEQLLANAERAAASESPADARALWAKVAHAWKEAGGAAAPPEIVERYRAAEALYARREAEWKAARAREIEQLRDRILALCDHAEATAASGTLQLKDADRLVRDLRTAMDQANAVHPRKLAEELVERVRRAQAALAPRVQELRESEEWRRWANAGVQEDLCKEAEALKDIADPAEVARRMRDLQARWKKVGAAPKERGEQLWLRFKAAIDENRLRLEPYFAQIRQAEAENLARRTALVERAEALADSTDWINTSEELKRLQAEWQQLGAAPRDQGQALWNRFRAACDRFFTRRKEDLAQRKQIWAENLRRKEALCQQAEALADSTDWDRGVAEIKRLQAEWRTIGPVKKNKSEAIWQRFRAACDAFFERYKHRDHLAAASAIGAREEIVADLERLAPLASSETPPEPAAIRDQALELWRRWKAAPHVPRAVADALERRFEAALLQAVAAWPDAFRGSRLDIDANRQRMQQLCAQVEGLVQGRLTSSELATAPPAALASMLKDALAANTIGGRVDEDARRRAAALTVREAQQEWMRLGPVPGDEGRQLAARFQRACQRFFDLRAAPAPGNQRTPTPSV